MATSAAPTPETLVAELVLLLDLEPRGEDRFVGRRKKGGVGRVFGGQAIAQASGAAERTVDETRQCHSLHCYFLRGGSEDYPIDFEVERDFDGGSFSNRRVVASQEGRPILNLTASFQAPQKGLEHQHPVMPAVPGPDELKSDAQLRRELSELLPNQYRDRLLQPWPIRHPPGRTPRTGWSRKRASSPLPIAGSAPSPNFPTIPASTAQLLAYASDDAFASPPAPARTASTGTAARSRPRASTMRSTGSTNPSAPTNGCCMWPTAPGPGGLARLYPGADLLGMTAGSSLGTAQEGLDPQDRAESARAGYIANHHPGERRDR